MKITAARISQLAFLALFLVLFVMTDYRGSDEIGLAVNGFFRANPFVLVSYLLAEKGFTLLLLPAVIATLFTVVLGRFFCGWICPLGTLIDLTTGKIRKSSPLRFLKGRFRFFLLFTLLTTSLFSVNISGVFDPIAILLRGLTFFFYPFLGWSVRSGWSGFYKLAGDGRDHVAFIYSFLRDYVLPFRETFYPLAFVSAALLLFIFFLERFEKRNWCKNICPLGTLLGLVGRFSLFKRVPGRLCSDCGDCRQICPTAFDEEILQEDSCIRCMECQVKCPSKRVRFPLRLKRLTLRQPEGSPDLSKRVFLAGIASGIVLSKAFTFRDPEKDKRLLRPPGVGAEDVFMKKCVRCGECMKVCLRSALYPDLSRAGAMGVFMPVVIPRLGYCEYNCTLCGQVCPTGAIPRLPVDEKQKAIIGKAVIDRNLCLPYAKRFNCLVCEEHCPIPDKAIRFETVTDVDYEGKRISLKRPYIVDDLCNGCGICENKCPLEGRSAIEVFAAKKKL